MDGKRLKFVLLGAGIGGCMLFLLVIGLGRPGGFSYYLTVTEFIDAPDRANEGFRINGKVEQGTIVRAKSGEDVSFTITDGNSTLPVDYHGIIPDTFVDGAEVVVEGSLEQDGRFVAHMLLAKCPSKYEAADGEEAQQRAALTVPSRD